MERLTDIQQLASLLAAELDTLVKSRPRTFDAGLVAAHTAAESICKELEAGLDLSPERYSAMVSELDAMLAPDQGKPELNRARDLFNQLRPPRAPREMDFIQMISGSRQFGYGIGDPEQPVPGESQSPVPSRQTRYAADIALFLLSRRDRVRYCEEWWAEIAYLPRRRQARHALGLLCYAWALRRALSDKPSRAPSVGLAIMVAIPGADAIAALFGLGWPAAAVGIGWGAGVAWTISDKERSRNLVSIIKAVRHDTTGRRKKGC
jgi:hypothetical protein